MRIGDVQGGKRTEVIGDEVGIDLRERTIISRPTLVPAGSVYQIQKNGQIIIVAGAVGTTSLLLPPSKTNAYDIRIRNRTGSVVTLEPYGQTLEDVRTVYTMLSNTCWLASADSSTWYIVLGS